MVASFVTSMVAMQTIPGRFAAGDPRADSWVLVVTVIVSTIVWVSVTLATRPEPDAVLDRFSGQVRPGRPGWRKVSERLGFGREAIPGGALNWTNWLAGVVAVYTSLFGIGQLILGDVTQGLTLLVVAAVAFAWIARSLRWTTSDVEAEAAAKARS